MPRCLTIVILLLSLAGKARAQEKITYDDQVTPILRNNCFKCHNPDKTKGDLDLTTYSALLKGGGSGKAVLPGDAAGSKLYKTVARTEEPFMPSNGPKMSDAEIQVIEKWIAGGLLEKSSSRALVSSSPKMAAMLKTAAQGKPAGPPVVPVDWLLNPVTRTEKLTAITALAASPWAPVIAVGGQHQLLVYNSETLDLSGVLPFPDGNPSCVRFSRDGRLLVIGGGRGAQFGMVDIYGLTTGERVARVGNEFDTVLAADLNSDQTEVALGGPGKHVKIFSVQDGRVLYDLKKHTDWVTALEYSPDSVLLVTGDRNGGLVVWEADSGQELYTLNGHTAAITSVSWRDDSEVLLSASEDGSVRLWEMREGRQVANLAAHGGGALDARFGHDARIVSCGRDKQIAVWDAAGKKQKNWEASGDLPVRVSFNHDGSRIVASAWSGAVSVWTAVDGKPVGEISSNPLTLAEQLEAANAKVKEREVLAARAAEASAAAEAEAAKIKATLAAHDQTSPAFQFLAATRQAQAAQRKSTEEAGKALEKLKGQAAKSTTELAAAAAEAKRLQVALEKVDQLSEPFKQLTQQLEAANQKVAAAAAKADEAGKLLAVQAAAVNAANADFATKSSAAIQARDQASAQLDELTKRFAAANQASAQARSAAAQDQTRLAQQQASVMQGMTLLTAAEAEVAKVTQALTTTDKSSPQGQELTKQLETATKQVTEATAAFESSQKAVGPLKMAVDKSTALAAAAEAETSKIKSSQDSSRAGLQTAGAALTQLETARASAADAAAKETAALQAAVTQTASALAAGKAESADLQAKLGKTEKFSPAFKEMKQALEAANKQAAMVRANADRDQKEVADLQGALEKINASAGAAEAEGAKTLALLVKSDAGFQRYQEIEKQLETANRKIAEVKSLETKARQEVETARGAVEQIKIAETQSILYHARRSLAAREQQHENVLNAAAAAEAESAKMTVALTETQARLTELTRQIAALTQQSAGHAAHLAATKAQAVESGRLLAAEKERVEKLASEHQRMKTAPGAK